MGSASVDEDRENHYMGKLFMFVDTLPMTSEYSDRGIVVLVYGVLFMDWSEFAGREIDPFTGVCLTHKDMIEHG